MLALKLQRLKYSLSNIFLVTLACLSVAPMTYIPTAIRIEKVETLVALSCVFLWGCRQIFYFISGLIRNQDTLYLWSLHTFSRVESCRERTWFAFFHALFRQKYFLILGNKQCGKSSLLKNAGAVEQQVPFEYQQKGLITHSVWSFDQNTLLESTALMPRNDETIDLQKKYWRNLIGLNKWHHSMSGFDGIIVVISIQNILNEQKSHPTQSLESLRSQIKSMSHDCSDVPVFIVLRAWLLPALRPLDILTKKIR